MNASREKGKGDMWELRNEGKKVSKLKSLSQVELLKEDAERRDE